MTGTSSFRVRRIAFGRFLAINLSFSQRVKSCRMGPTSEMVRTSVSRLIFSFLVEDGEKPFPLQVHEPYIVKCLLSLRLLTSRTSQHSSTQRANPTSSILWKEPISSPRSGNALTSKSGKCACSRIRVPTRYVALVTLGRLPSKQYLRTGGVTSSSLKVLAGLALSMEECVDLMTTALPGFRAEAPLQCRIYLQLAYNQVQLLLRFTISHNVGMKLNHKL